MVYNDELPSQTIQPVTITTTPNEKCPYKPLSINYCNLIANLFLVIQLSTIFIILGVYANDASKLLRDAQTNMDDLSIILPKVSETLKIVEEICKAPEYAPYCRDNGYY